MGKRPWNKKERELKVREIQNRETFLLLSISRTFITNNGFIVAFGNIFMEIVDAYYVDKNYNDIKIGSYNKHDEKLYEKIEKFRFEIEGELDND